MAIAIVLIVLGFLLSFIGGIWGLVLAFQESAVWGLLYLFVPFASLVFVITKWGKPAVKNSFLLGLLGLGIAMLGAVLGGRMAPSMVSNLDIPGSVSIQLPTDTVMPTGSTPSSIQPAPTVPQPPTSAPPVSGTSDPAVSAPASPNQPYDYRQSMLVGYAAFEQKDYQTALINFKRAAQVRPGDPYATKAIQNTEAVLQAAQ